MEEQREELNLLLYLIFGVKGTVFYGRGFFYLYCSLFLINSSDWELLPYDYGLLWQVTGTFSAMACSWNV